MVMNRKATNNLEYDYVDVLCSCMVRELSTIMAGRVLVEMFRDGKYFHAL